MAILQAIAFLHLLGGAAKLAGRPVHLLPQEDGGVPVNR